MHLELHRPALKWLWKPFGFVCLFFFVFSCTEHRAGHCFLPQSPWHESPGVPYVILLIVVFVIPLSEPSVSFSTLSRHRHTETALPCRQTAQGHQWIGGDWKDLRQSEFPDSLVCLSILRKVYEKKSASFVNIITDMLFMSWCVIIAIFVLFKSLCFIKQHSHQQTPTHALLYYSPSIWSQPDLVHISSLCQDLNCLIERYLTPLQKESFLTHDEVR